MAKAKKTVHPGLYQLDDGRYRIRPTVQCPRTGRMLERQRTLPQGITEHEALRELDDLRQQLLTGADPAPRQRRITLSDYAEQWLEAKAARLKPSVAVHYTSVLANKILPELGDLYIDTITRRDIERWVAWSEKVRKPNGQTYSQATVRGWWRVLACLVRDAAAERRFPDPTVRIKPPTLRGGKKRETRVLSTEQLGALLEALEQVAPHRYAEVFTMSYTGMRSGELYSLTWDDIDFEAGIIHIRTSVWKGQVGTTKTLDPRQVPMVGEMVDVLQSHRREMVATQHRGVHSGLVFPSRTGRHRDANSLLKPLAAATEYAGIDIHVTAQVLRRTFNTLLLRANVDRIVLRAMMGHTSEEMTQRYAGVALEDKKMAVAKLLQFEAK